MIEIDGIKTVYAEGVYTPSHDSYILLTTVINAEICSNIKHICSGVELGSGTGYVTAGLIKAKKIPYAIMIDIDSYAVYSSWATAKENSIDMLVDVVQCDGATCIRSNSINIVYFNPPYLPVCDDFDDAIAWNGGSDGLEVWNKFFSESCRICANGCVIAFVFSSLQDLEKMFKNISICSTIEIFLCQSFFYETVCGMVVKCD